MSDIAKNLKAVRLKIEAALKASGQDTAAVNLIAVSKTKPESDVRAALAAGQRCFGENRVQEAKAKFTALHDEYPDIKLHLIGPLQTNKAEEAVKLFDVIETLDRLRLAETLATAIKKTGRHPAFYIEVNVGNEPQKAGITPDDVGAFIDFCRTKCGLNVAGLMCIPPQRDDPEPHFKRMKELAAKYGLKRLSMGMSADFEAAIQCGATEVRVGTAIFGARNNTKPLQAD